MQERSAQTRASIVVAAATVFCDRGYRDTALHLVADRAGVSVGALYFHFPSKESLARHLIDEQMERSAQRATEVAAAGHRAVDALTHLSASYGYDLLTDPIMHAGTLLSTELEIFSETSRASWQYWIDGIRVGLDQGVVEGDVSPDADTVALSECISPAFAGIRLASELLGHRDRLLDRLLVLSEVFIPAFAVPDRADALIASARSIFAEYARRLAVARPDFVSTDRDMRG